MLRADPGACVVIHGGSAGRSSSTGRSSIAFRIAFTSSSSMSMSSHSKSLRIRITSSRLSATCSVPGRLDIDSKMSMSSSALRY